MTFSWVDGCFARLRRREVPVLRGVALPPVPRLLAVVVLRLRVFALALLVRLRVPLCFEDRDFVLAIYLPLLVGSYLRTHCGNA